MDWKDKNWDEEDVLYAQKRKITNKGSDKKPFFIGSFPSKKNPNSNRITQWGSLNEKLFYYLLELDPHIIRYYVQPVEVQIPYLNKDGEKRTWIHTSDVLFFKQGWIPYLCQIKESPEDVNDKMKLINKHCQIYAEKQGWGYAVIYPKRMPEIFKKNLEFLMGCYKVRQGYTEWIERLIGRIRDLGKVKIVNISLSFGNPLFLNPIVYHMISVGLLSTDISQPLTSESFVWLADDSRYSNSNFERAGGLLELFSAQSKF